MLLRRSLLRTKHHDIKEREDKVSAGLYEDIHENITYLKETLGNPDDLVIRRFKVGKNESICAIAYIKGLVDDKLIQNNILETLQWKTSEIEIPQEKLFDELFFEFVSIAGVTTGTSFDNVVNGLLTGSTILFVQNINKAILMKTEKSEKRSIQEPVSESLIRGPRNGFIEDLGTNIAMIRREIHDPNLRVKTYQVGRRGKKTLAMLYIEGIVHPEILAEVNRRLETIDMDSALDSGFIEEWIEDTFLSPFPQIIDTERPDKSVGAVLQGKVLVILDGSPFALIMPATLGNVLQSPEDYYGRWMIGTLIRVLRYLGAFIALFLPGLYIALVSFHQDLIPSELAFSIASTREGVPFPVVIEAILMVTTMEFLREAGARLPKTIGQTIGIVGGLVIGEAAVQAGVVSPVMVIVVALTAIATFSIPLYSAAIAFRLFRYGIMAGAAFLGLYGIILIYIVINIHIVNLKSFGIPYSTPFSPTIKNDWQDLILRAPVQTFTKRPAFLQPRDVRKGDKT